MVAATPLGVQAQHIQRPGQRYILGWHAATQPIHPTVYPDMKKHLRLPMYGGLRYASGGVEHYGFVPHWCLAIVTGILPAVWAAMAFRRRRVAAAGLCPTCGYDLRASPDRCPECGKSNATAAAA
jgi:hypothetical protein